MMADRITIVMPLPQPIENVTAVLTALERCFPDAKVELDHPDGWHIILPTPED